MNISSLVTSKGLLGILASIGATTAGVVYFSVGGEKEVKNTQTLEVNVVEGDKKDEKVGEKEDFDERVKRAFNRVGMDVGWCVKEGNKYVCRRMADAKKLGKMKFSNLYQKDVDFKMYMINGNVSSPDIEVEILDTNDKLFEDGVKFSIVKSNVGMQIRKSTTDGSGIMELPLNSNGEFSFGNGRMGWVWQEINNLSGKVGLGCRDWDSVNNKFVYDCSPTEGNRINVRNGNDVMEGVEMEIGKKFRFERNQEDCFQGYRFTVQEDIKLNGGKKLNKGDKYQIIRDSVDETKWYLSKK